MPQQDISKIPKVDRKNYYLDPVTAQFRRAGRGRDNTGHPIWDDTMDQKKQYTRKAATIKHDARLTTNRYEGKMLDARKRLMKKRKAVKTPLTVS